jgi:hypothetical protein
MASVVINGDTSGAVTISAPAVAGTTTLTLPATSGTILQSGTTVTEAQGGTGTTTGYYGFKNRIINGAMVIDQRNAGASVTLASGGTYTVDRWQGYEDTDGVMTAQQNSSAPTGFINSLKLTTTTADSSLASTQFALIQQKIEGFNISDLGWGTASAATVALSFWVRSSLTGTFGGSLRNSAQTRSYPFTFTISTADTWEQKTITIAGDTSGTWLTTNGIGIHVAFGLGVGSTYSGTAGAWATAQYFSATGATSVIGTLNATFYITGVQLEKGSTATSFDYRPYGTELQLCQRYYYKIQADDTSYLFGTGFAFSAINGAFTGSFPVTMRVSPTALEQNGTASHYTVQTGGVDRASSAVVAYQSITTQNTWSVQTTVASGQTTGFGGVLYGQNVTAYLGWSAEL